MKFRDADGMEVVEISVVNVGFFKFVGMDGDDYGLFLEPDYTVNPDRINADFRWVDLLEKSGIPRAVGPAGMLFYQRGGTNQWPCIAFGKNYPAEPKIKMTYRGSPDSQPVVIMDDSKTITRRMRDAHRN